MFPIVINYIFHLATASIAHRTSFFDLPWPDNKSFAEKCNQSGFKFIGPTIVDSFLMSSGFINGHEPKCYKYSKI